MQNVRLGPDGPLMPQIGIGGMSFADFYGPATEDGSHAILRAALEAGVSHLDTSNVYGMGKSERAIGSFLAANPGARDQFQIATKAGITKDADGNRCYRNDAAYLEAELDGSLKRLGVEAVDLFYVHRREEARPIEEVADTLAGLIKKGKVKAVGFSEIAPSSLRRASMVCPIAAVQSEYSLSTRQPELGLVQTCAELGTSLVAFSPVGRGMLTDYARSPDELKKLPFLSGNPRFSGENYAANLKKVQEFQSLARELGVSTAALAIGWVIAQGDHVLPIPGTRSPAHFAELVEGAGLNLGATELAAIDAVLPVGWAHGARYTAAQAIGPENYC